MGEHLIEIASLFFLVGGIAAIVGFVMLAKSMADDEQAPMLRRRGLIYIVTGALCLLAGGTFCTAGFVSG